jgi:hypothetical protein
MSLRVLFPPQTDGHTSVSLSKRPETHLRNLSTITLPSCRKTRWTIWLFDIVKAVPGYEGVLQIPDDDLC